jgi:hypothetical protein
MILKKASKNYCLIYLQFVEDVERREMDSSAVPSVIVFTTAVLNVKSKTGKKMDIRNSVRN